MSKYKIQGVQILGSIICVGDSVELISGDEVIIGYIENFSIIQTHLRTNELILNLSGGSFSLEEKSSSSPPLRTIQSIKRL